MPGQGLESHLRGQLLLVCGSEEMRVSGEVPCGGSGDEDSALGVLGCQGQWGSSVMPSLCRCEFRRLYPIQSLVTAVSRARLRE